MKLNVVQSAGVVALIVAPVVALLLPREVRENEVFRSVTVKDAINVAALIVLGSIVFVQNVLAQAINLVRWGVYYDHVEHNFFYDADQGVLTRSTFGIVAPWRGGVEFLPGEGFLWWKEIDRDQVYYRLVHRGKRRTDRKIYSSGGISIEPVEVEAPGAEGAAVSRLQWRPKIAPQLASKESISYQAEVHTPGTESAAFKPGGSTMGFPVSLPTNVVKFRAFAPIGYSFELLEPRVSVRDIESSAQIAGVTVKDPAISPDGTMLEWTLRYPRKSRRYWVHYRFKQNEVKVR